MPGLVITMAVFNMALGFVLAVYFGAAPRFANSRVPFSKAAHRDPPALLRRILAFLPKRRPANPLP